MYSASRCNDSTVSWTGCWGTISWGAVDGAVEYFFRWSTDEGEGRERQDGGNRSGWVKQTNTSKTLYNLYCQTNYVFQVEARGAGDDGDDETTDLLHVVEHHHPYYCYQWTIHPAGRYHPYKNPRTFKQALLTVRSGLPGATPQLGTTSTL